MMEKVTTRELFIIRPEGVNKEADHGIGEYIASKMLNDVAVYKLQIACASSIKACEQNVNGIKNADEVLIWWKKGDDDVLFCCGIAFGLGKRIRLINSAEVHEEEKKVEGKSFGKVLLRLNDEATGQNSELGSGGVAKVKAPNDAFLICRVRGAPKEVLDENQKYVDTYALSGRKMYYPPVDTDQSDSIGLEICRENREGIRNAKEVHVKLDKNSKGSVFDLGMAVGLGKPMVLVNEPEVREWEKGNPDWSYGKLLLWLDNQRRLGTQNLSCVYKRIERKA